MNVIIHNEANTGEKRNQNIGHQNTCTISRESRRKFLALVKDDVNKPLKELEAEQAAAWVNWIREEIGAENAIPSFKASDFYGTL